MGYVAVLMQQAIVHGAAAAAAVAASGAAAAALALAAGSAGAGTRASQPAYSPGADDAASTRTVDGSGDGADTPAAAANGGPAPSTAPGTGATTPAPAGPLAAFAASVAVAAAGGNSASGTSTPGGTVSAFKLATSSATASPAAAGAVMPALATEAQLVKLLSNKHVLLRAKEVVRAIPAQYAPAVGRVLLGQLSTDLKVCVGLLRPAGPPVSVDIWVWVVGASGLGILSCGLGMPVPGMAELATGLSRVWRILEAVSWHSDLPNRESPEDRKLTQMHAHQPSHGDQPYVLPQGVQSSVNYICSILRGDPAATTPAPTKLPMWFATASLLNTYNQLFKTSPTPLQPPLHAPTVGTGAAGPGSQAEQDERAASNGAASTSAASGAGEAGSGGAATDAEHAAAAAPTAPAAQTTASGTAGAGPGSAALGAGQDGAAAAPSPQAAPDASADNSGDVEMAEASTPRAGGAGVFGQAAEEDVRAALCRLMTEVAEGLHDAVVKAHGVGKMALLLRGEVTGGRGCRCADASVLPALRLCAVVAHPASGSAPRVECVAQRSAALSKALSLPSRTPNPHPIHQHLPPTRHPVAPSFPPPPPRSQVPQHRLLYAGGAHRERAGGTAGRAGAGGRRAGAGRPGGGAAARERAAHVRGGAGAAGRRQGVRDHGERWAGGAGPGRGLGGGVGAWGASACVSQSETVRHWCHRWAACGC